MEAQVSVFPRTQLKVPRKNTARKTMHSAVDYAWLEQQLLEDEAQMAQQQASDKDRATSNARATSCGPDIAVTDSQGHLVAKTSISIAGTRVSVTPSVSTKTCAPPAPAVAASARNTADVVSKGRPAEEVPSRVKVKVSAKNGAVISTKGRTPVKQPDASKPSKANKRHSDGHQNVVSALFDSPLMVSRNPAAKPRPMMGTLMRAPTVRASMESTKTTAKSNGGHKERGLTRVSSKHVKKSNSSLSKHKKHKRTLSDPSSQLSKEKKEQKKKLKSRKYSYQPMESTPIKTGARETLRDILSSELCESIASMGSVAGEHRALMASRTSLNNETPVIITAGNNPDQSTASITSTASKAGDTGASKQASQSSVSGQTLGKSSSRSQLTKQSSKSKLGRHRSVSNQETSSTSESSRVRSSTVTLSVQQGDGTRKRSSSESCRSPNGDNVFEIMSKIKKAKLSHPENSGVAENSRSGRRLSDVTDNSSQAKAAFSDASTSSRLSVMGNTTAASSQRDNTLEATGTPQHPLLQKKGQRSLPPTESEIGLLADVQQAINALEKQNKHRGGKEQGNLRRHSSSKHKSHRSGSVSHRRRPSSVSSASSVQSSDQNTGSPSCVEDGQTLKDDQVFAFNTDNCHRTQKLAFDFNFAGQAKLDGDRHEQEEPLKLKLKRNETNHGYAVVEAQGAVVQEDLLTGASHRESALRGREGTAADAKSAPPIVVDNDSDATRPYGEDSDEDRLVIDVEGDSLISSSVARCINQPLTSTPSNELGPGKAPAGNPAGSRSPGASAICLEQDKEKSDCVVTAVSMATISSAQPRTSGDTMVTTCLSSRPQADSKLGRRSVSPGRRRSVSPGGGRHIQPVAMVTAACDIVEFAPIRSEASGKSTKRRSGQDAALQSRVVVETPKVEMPKPVHGDAMASDHTLSMFSATGPLHSTMVTSAQVPHSIPGLQLISPVVAVAGGATSSGADFGYTAEGLRVKTTASPEARSSCMYAPQLPMAQMRGSVHRPPPLQMPPSVPYNPSNQVLAGQTPPHIISPQFASPVKIRQRGAATFSFEPQTVHPSQVVSLVRHPVESLYMVQNAGHHGNHFPRPAHQMAAPAGRPPAQPYLPPRAPLGRQVAPPHDHLNHIRHMVAPGEVEARYMMPPPTDLRVGQPKHAAPPSELSQPQTQVLNLASNTHNHNSTFSSTAKGTESAASTATPISVTSVSSKALSPQSSKVLQEVEGLLRQAWEFQTTALQALQSNLSHKYNQVESLKSELSEERQRRHLVEQQLYQLQASLQGAPSTTGNN